MKDTTFHYLIAVMRYGYGNNSRAARHIGIDPRTFRAVLLQKASLFRCILSARVVFLRAVIRELRQAGAVSDESIMEAVKLVKSRIKNDAA
jgi:hypothetical protein